MRLRFKTLSLFVVVFSAAVCCLAGGGGQEDYAKAAKSLPDMLGDFKAATPVVPFEAQSADKIKLFDAISAASRSYRYKDGETVSVFLVVTSSDSSAYALLTNWGCSGQGSGDDAKLRAVLGTKRCVLPAKIEFARGPVFVDVEFKKGVTGCNFE